ncbi:MAG TPA: twin-arginine translocase subunit TatC [Gemmatimonadales bacterium]|nr:twin-arginine translocase subunit TatC [Gemmatimonadales bacterium]
MLDKAIERRNKDGVMGLGEHLEELRKRVLLAVLGLLPIFLVCLYFGDKLVRIAIEPASMALRAQGEPANYQLNNALEGFGAYVKIAAIITLSVAGPWVIFQLWKFIAPGLYAKERRFVYVLAPFSTFMAVGGLAFAYFVVLKVMFSFLIGFNATLVTEQVIAAPLPQGTTLVSTVSVLQHDPPDPKVGMEWVNTSLMERRICIGEKDGKPDIVGQPLSHSGSIAQQYRLKETLDQVVMTCLATIAGFQTPVVVLLLGWAGIVNPRTLWKYWKHAFAVCAVLGAVLTPSPDPGSMLLIAVPMFMLYLLGLVLVVLFPATRIMGEKPEPTSEGEGGGP